MRHEPSKAEIGRSPCLKVDLGLIDAKVRFPKQPFIRSSKRCFANERFVVDIYIELRPLHASTDDQQLRISVCLFDGSSH